MFSVLVIRLRSLRFFFFQAEDGIRDDDVTGVQTCALPILILLEEVDRICQKHQLSYMLFAGTLLGAVRHKDFIPWEDDIDVLMPREDYQRFLDIAQRECDKNVFFVQREFSHHWPMHFSKLRLQNTAYIEKYHPKDPLQHQGIYIDYSDRKSVV